MIWPATPGLLCGGGLHVDQLQGHDLDTTLGVLVPMTNRWVALLPRMRDNEESLIWVNYNDLTATSLEIILSKGNHPKMALIQVSEIL